MYTLRKEGVLLLNLLITTPLCITKTCSVYLFCSRYPVVRWFACRIEQSGKCLPDKRFRNNRHRHLQILFEYKAVIWRYLLQLPKATWKERQVDSPTYPGVHASDGRVTDGNRRAWYYNVIALNVTIAVPKDKELQPIDNTCLLSVGRPLPPHVFPSLHSKINV